MGRSLYIVRDAIDMVGRHLSMQPWSPGRAQLELWLEECRCAVDGWDTAPPTAEERWDQAAAAVHSAPDEIAWGIEVYSEAFVAAMPVHKPVREVLERLSRDHRVAILSNWPLAATVDRYAEAAGWLPHLTSIVVSQRVGTIKPGPTELLAPPARAVFVSYSLTLGLTPQALC